MSILSVNCNYIEKNIQKLSGLSTFCEEDRYAIEKINDFKKELEKLIYIYYKDDEE